MPMGVVAIVFSISSRYSSACSTLVRYFFVLISWGSYCSRNSLAATLWAVFSSAMLVQTTSPSKTAPRAGQSQSGHHPKGCGKNQVSSAVMPMVSALSGRKKA